MMNIQEFTNMNNRFLCIGIPAILATLFLAALLGTSASSASTVEQASIDQEYGILSNGTYITIGVATTMSGIPDIGWRQTNAVQLAVDQVNAAGGIDISGTTYTLALVSADSGCNSTQAINAANTLLSAGVVAVIGHSCSVTSMAAQPLYAATGVAMVSPSTTNPDMTEQGYTTTFRVITRDDSLPILMATHFRNRLNLDRAAIVELSGSWNFPNDVFEHTFTNLGGTITSRRTVTSTADYTATLTTIKGENPDVIIYADVDANDAGLLSRIAHGVGMTDVIIGWNTRNNNRAVLNDYATAAGEAAEGDHAGMFGRNTDDMPGYDALNTAYQAAGFPNYGDEVQSFGAFAYDAVIIIIAAIDRSDSNNPSDILDEIADTTNYYGVVGTYEGFDAKGDVIPQLAWLEQYQNGKWEMIGLYQVYLPITLRISGQ